MKKPLKAQVNRVIAEVTLVCPECYTKGVYGLEQDNYPEFIDCSDTVCEYKFQKEHLPNVSQKD